jgi:hypothetical protein
VRARLLLAILLFVICVACAIKASAVEIPIGESPVGAASFHRAAPVAASNGRAFLTAWIDYRNSVSEIFAMRSASDGTPLDRVAFRVAKPLPGRLINSIAIASDGIGYVIAYTESQPQPQVVRFAHIDDAGVVTLRDLIPNAADVSIAWSGKSYVAAYRTGEITYAAVVDRDGSVLRERTPLIGSGAWAFRVSGGANGHVIATWLTGNSAVAETPIDSTALLEGKFPPLAVTETLPTLFYAQPPVVASAGDGHLIVWAEVMPAAYSQAVLSTIRARRLDTNGNVTGTPFTVAETASPYVNVVAATWTGSSYVVAYVDVNTGRVRTQRIDASGFTTAADMTADGDDVEIALASTGRGDVFAVWSRSSSARRMFGAMLDAAGAINSEPQLLTRATPAQSEPQLTTCAGSGYVAAWVESSDRARVVFDRVAANGVPSHASGAAVVESNNHQTHPAVACSSANALVTWTDSDERANTHGFAELFSLSDRSIQALIPLGAMPPGQRPAVVWNGNEYLIAWQSFETRQLQLARVTSDGQIRDVIPRVIDGGSSPSLAWNGSQYLLAWLSEFSATVPETMVSIPLQRAKALRMTVELNAAGSPIDLYPTGDGDDARAPIAAASPTGWQITWRQRAKWFSVYSLTTARIDRSGDYLGSHFVFNLPDNVAFDANAVSIVFARTLVHLDDRGAETLENLITASDAAVAVSHGSDSRIIYTRTSDDESMPRLFIEASPAPRRRALR